MHLLGIVGVKTQCLGGNDPRKPKREEYTNQHITEPRAPNDRQVACFGAEIPTYVSSAGDPCMSAAGKLGRGMQG